MKTIRKISLKDYNKMTYNEKEALPAKTRQVFDRDNACEYLLKVTKKNTTIYTLLRNVSSSGMSRRISCFIVNDGQVEDITFYVARVLESKRNKRDGGITVSGCGMDMGFDLVYRLSSELHGHENRGGYVLNHSWL
jgi:uncharacterized protein YjaZ